MGKLVTCDWCEATSDLEFTSKCYGCDRDLTESIPSKGSKRKNQPSVNEDTLETDPKLIKAINRATFALRSLALFVFTSTCSTLFGYALIAAGSGNPVRCAINGSDCGNAGLLTFGWVVVVAGFVIALVLGISELNKSRP